MIRVRLIDGSTQEFRREEIVSVLPAEGLLRHPLLRFDGIISHHGRIVPVTGPLPAGRVYGGVDERAWLLFFGDHAQVIQGLPEFDDDVSVSRTVPTLVTSPVQEETPPESAGIDDAEEERLLREMEELLKGA